ncbi:hypothetical protein J6590_102799, partial [Homalodisca vitripennis]
LIVATLPHRHDLPVNHAINEEVVLVNATLKNWLSGTTSRHGLHLTMRGKWLLAKLIAETLCKVDHAPHKRTGRASCGHFPPSRLDHAVTPAPPADPGGPPPPAHPRSPAAHTSPAPPEPTVRTMAYDTFPEAVKSERPADLHLSDNSGQKNCQFLTNAKEG